MAEGLLARALGCRGARQLIKLSFWVQIGVEPASLDLDMCRVKLHATRRTKPLSSPPSLCPPLHYVLNALGCAHSSSIITSLIAVYPQYSSAPTTTPCLFAGAWRHFSAPYSPPCVFMVYVSSPHASLYCTLPLLLPSSFYDLHILSDFRLLLCLLCLLLGIFGTKPFTREQAKRQGEGRQGGRWRMEQRKRNGVEACGAAASQGPVAAGADRGAGGDLQRQSPG